MTMNTYHSRALIAWVAAVLAVGLMVLVGPKPAWAAEPNFAPTQHFSVGTSPTTVTNADFNGDGKVDLAAQNSGSNTVSVLTGNGEGTFDPKQDFTVGANPSSVVSSEFNGDGKTDLAVANYSSNTVSVLLGNGDGTFQTAQPYSVSVGGAPAPTRSSLTTSMETATLISRPRT
jgi:hypothetical protein